MSDLFQDLNADLQSFDIQIDTSKAREKMKGLGRRRAQSSRKGWVSATRHLGNWGNTTIRHMGLGLPAVGFNAHRSRVAASFAGNADPWAHALTPARAAMQKYIDDWWGVDVRASRQSRKATVAKFGDHFMRHKETAGILAYRASLQEELTVENDGRNVLRMSDELKTPTLAEMLTQAVKGYVTLIKQAGDWWIKEATK